MDSVVLSDVQRANLTMLLTMRERILHDPGLACCIFRLDSTELEALAALSPDRLLSIVSTMGHESLFQPRRDLVRLLDLPPRLGACMAAAGQPERRPPPLRAIEPAQ